MKLTDNEVIGGLALGWLVALLFHRMSGTLARRLRGRFSGLPLLAANLFLFTAVIVTIYVGARFGVFLVQQVGWS
jgi:hypothetical protein